MSQDKNTTTKQIALTFDDGPNTTITPLVLDKLEKYHVIASFYVIGNLIDDESAKMTKRAFDMGCEINNHSFTHCDMRNLTKEQIAEEIQVTTDKIVEITGVTPKFFRPPFIYVNQEMFDTIELPFICGQGAEDWVPEVSSEERARRIIEAAKDGMIILLHDLVGNMKTVDALDTIIPALLDMGYTFVTTSELFASKGIDPKPHTGIIYTNVTDDQKFLEL